MSNANYTIKILENDFGKSGNGFNKKPIFEFTGQIERFNLKAFEKKLKSIHGKQIMSWAIMSFYYGFMLRVALSL